MFPGADDVMSGFVCVNMLCQLRSLGMNRMCCQNLRHERLQSGLYKFAVDDDVINNIVICISASTVWGRWLLDGGVHVGGFSVMSGARSSVWCVAPGETSYTNIVCRH